MQRRVLSRRTVRRIRLRGLGDDSVFTSAFGPFNLSTIWDPIWNTIENALPTWAGGTGGQLTPDQVQQAISSEAASVYQAGNGSVSYQQALSQAIADQTALHTQQVNNPLPNALTPWLWLLAAGAGFLLYEQVRR